MHFMPVNGPPEFMGLLTYTTLLVCIRNRGHWALSFSLVFWVHIRGKEFGCQIEVIGSLKKIHEAPTYSEKSPFQIQNQQF